MSSWLYVADGDDESRHGYVVTGFGGGAVGTTTALGDVDVERGGGGTTTASGLPPTMSVHARNGSDVSVMSYASAMSVVAPTMVEEHARVSIAVGGCHSVRVFVDARGEWGRPGMGGGY